MSIDRLQEKIRKYKNPTVLELDFSREQIPAYLFAEEGNDAKAYARFCIEFLELLRGFVPAVRVSFAAFAFMGTDGLVALSRVLNCARENGYYIILEVPEALSAQRAQQNADILFAEGCLWECDAYLICAYIGSEAIKPYMARLQDSDKALFVMVRSGNRSATELQDLLSGGRHVFEAMADIVNRFKNTQATKSGYDRIAIVGPATSADILRKLRQKYKNLFILVDGYDVSGANAKNCAEAADQLGHGIAVCSGTTIGAAWCATGLDGREYLENAQEIAERMKKNLARYFTVL